MEFVLNIYHTYKMGSIPTYVSKDSVRAYCAHRRLSCSKHQLSNAPIIVRVFKGHGGGEGGGGEDSAVLLCV